MEHWIIETVVTVVIALVSGVIFLLAEKVKEKNKLK